MQRIPLNIFLSSIFLFVLLPEMESIKCYQCVGSDPTKPFQCNEWLDSDTDLEPQSCDHVYGAKYCIKHTGRYDKGIGAKRFCSSLDLGNYCNYVRQPGDTLQYRTCIHTCTGDGCNTGSRIKYVGVFTCILCILNFLL